MLTMSSDAAGVNGGVSGAVHPVLCNCPICRGLNREDRGKGGTGFFNKQSYTVEQAGAHITRTEQTWNGVGDTALGRAAKVTYSFRATGVPDDIDGVSGDNRFSAQQITQAELALAAWSDVANITFMRVKDTDSEYSDRGQIRLENYHEEGGAGAAFAILPNTYGKNDPNAQYSGDLWVNNGLDYNADPKLGNYGRLVLVHELGHTIGLSHPGDYNAGEGDPSYADADYAEDTLQYSVMSYWGERNTGANFQGLYAAAPMLDDIAAAQRLYGANTTTRVGDTVYGFGSNTGRDWLTATAGSPIIAAIWDAGGIDTLNFSGYGMSQIIDLGQGNFSSTGGLTGNVAIAAGTVIEDAIGGTGADRIIGNTAANVLDGHGGSDQLEGLAGNDRLIAGAGGSPLVRASRDLVRSTRGAALSLDDAFSIGADPAIDNAMKTPHATVLADANGTNEFYSLTVVAGQTITLDVDFSGFDSLVTLYDAGGRKVASNDDNDVVDPGSTGYRYDVNTTKTVDSFLTYTAKASGTYYVEVRGIYGGQPVGPTPNYGSYQLNVSVTGHTLVAGPVGSTLDGGDGADLLVSGSAGDTLLGGFGADTVSYAAATGGVHIFLSQASAQATGGSGSDRLSSIENLTGSSFDDELIGSGAANRLSGGDGNDTLFAGVGNDRLNGGSGADSLTGGSGVDRFEFTVTLGSSNIDTITDFTAADDTIVLGAGVFRGLSAGVLAGGAFHTGSGAHDGDDRIIYNSATGALLFDRDGTGSAAAAQFARIDTGLRLTSADFQVV